MRVASLGSSPFAVDETWKNPDFFLQEQSGVHAGKSIPKLVDGCRIHLFTNRPSRAVYNKREPRRALENIFPPKGSVGIGSTGLLNVGVVNVKSNLTGGTMTACQNS